MCKRERERECVRSVIHTWREDLSLASSLPLPDEGVVRQCMTDLKYRHLCVCVCVCVCVFTACKSMSIAVVKAS